MSTGKKILVVDDDKHLLEMLKMELEYAGYEVFTAGAMQDSLNIVKQREVALAFLDLNLGETDGVQVYKQLKKIRPEIIGVIFTGTAETYTKLQQKIVESDIIDRFLRKPLQAGEIVKAAKELLS